MGDYAIAFGLVFAINLLPAFGPPTWAVLVFLVFNLDLEPVILVPCGAVAAASGRFLLASGARRARGLLDPKRIEGLDAARDYLLRSRARAGTGLALFALSPVPSAQLFIAAGLLCVPLVPLTLAFFSGRLVSYSIYVGAASAAGKGLGEIVGDSLTTPWGIALQIAMLAGLVALVRVDWVSILARRGRGDRGGPSAATTEIDPDRVRMAATSGAPIVEGERDDRDRDEQ